MPLWLCFLCMVELTPTCFWYQVPLSIFHCRYDPLNIWTMSLLIVIAIIIKCYGLIFSATRTCRISERFLQRSFHQEQIRGTSAVCWPVTPFQTRRSGASSEPVPTLKPVICASPAKELALAVANKCIHSPCLEPQLKWYQNKNQAVLSGSFGDGKTKSKTEWFQERWVKRRHISSKAVF